MKYEHIVFDLDGTLIDTEEAVLSTWQATLKEYHYDYPLEELKIVLGITTQNALEKLKAKVSDDFEKQWALNYHRVVHKMAFFDGVEDMLLALDQKGCALGIVTSRRRKELLDYFLPFNLEALFPIIICADDTVNHKPYPEPLLKYAELAKADPASCIYIGDMPTDIACANQAGITSGFVTWKNSGVRCQEAIFEFSCPSQICDAF